MSYDIIGDIHGHATHLKKLLEKLGYQNSHGVWRHPSRRVIFLGDFIDRGPEQIEAVAIARNMVENGHALAVMGNHEFNAIGWAMPDPDAPGAAIREHSDKNHRQHQEFLRQVGEGSGTHYEMVEWFKTLPLYLDLEGLRVVHACWHNPSIQEVLPHVDEQARVLPMSWRLLSDDKTPEGAAVETLIKGRKIRLPEGCSFTDVDGNHRTKMRTRWWDVSARTYRDLALVPQQYRQEIPNVDVEAGMSEPYRDEKPLFVGHYWLTGEPEPLGRNIACVDYSIAKSGPGSKLCAYRWDGETRLCSRKFVWVGF